MNPDYILSTIVAAASAYARRLNHERTVVLHPIASEEDRAQCAAILRRGQDARRAYRARVALRRALISYYSGEGDIPPQRIACESLTHPDVAEAVRAGAQVSGMPLSGPVPGEWYWLHLTPERA